MRQTGLQTLRGIVSISWNAFVAAFLYYTALVLLTVSGAELSATFMLVSFALPAVAYVTVVMVRGAHLVGHLDLAPGVRPATAS